MATTMRSVDTRFWVDSWVRKLNPLDRYVFLYFLTNTHSSWCGVYELDISMASFECGIEQRDLENSILPRLSPKIIYVDGWVYIANFEKYHNSTSLSTQKGIENAWKVVPERIRLKIREIESAGGGLEGASPFASASALASTSKPVAPVVDKVACGEFKNVLLTPEEKKKLVERYGRTATITSVDELSTYMKSKGKAYRDHYATLLNWAKRKGVAEVAPPAPPPVADTLTPEQIAENQKRQAGLREALAEKLKMKK